MALLSNASLAILESAVFPYLVGPAENRVEGQEMSARVAELLLRCGTEAAILPPTELYNEGWLLRLVLDWFEHERESGHVLAFHPNARWYSEALLASRFLPTSRGDPLAESFTHADAVVGHFDISPGERGEAVARGDSGQFVVLEAKLGSGLSKGVKNAPDFGQAARNVACIAHAANVAGLHPEANALGFYVLAPEQQIRSGIFSDFVTKERIRSQVKARVDQFAGVHDSWFEEVFLPTLSAVSLDLLSWESIVEYIEARDAGTGIRDFYDRCLKFNPMRGRSPVG